MSYSIIEQIKEHEGFSEKPYKCPTGHLTIGYGFNLEAGIDEELATTILQHQLRLVYYQCIENFPWFESLGKMRQGVIINMIFNLGLTGFKGFKNMIKAIEEERHDDVVKEMLDSKWAHQVKGRAWELADQWRDNCHKE